MLQAIIMMIPKPGKCTDYPANFRLILLLNHDINLFSNILANRLYNILPTLISLDQVRFYTNRQSRDGTRRLLDPIQLARISSEYSVLISLEVVKASDKMNWAFLKKVLQKFRFSGPIYDAVCSLFTSPLTVFTVGCFSPFQSPMELGRRDPCHPLLFLCLLNP